MLLLVLLAGMAAVLASPTAGGLLDKSDYDAALVAVWTFVAGGIYGAVGYFLTGFGLFFGARLLGSLGDFRRERQLVGFALAPLALSFLVLLPARLLVYGGDTFRRSGADEGPRGNRSSSYSSPSSRGRWRCSSSESASCTGGAGSARSRRSAPSTALLVAVVGVFAML